MINRFISRIIPYFPKNFIWLFSKKYIAGVTLEDEVRIAKAFNDEGIEVSIDLLGENITNMSEAEIHKNEYLNIIQQIQEKPLKTTFSIKPTMFGLLIDKEKCFELIEIIIKEAIKANRMVRLDMEDSRCVDLELDMFSKLYQKYPENVGIVLQAYLKRTYQDILDLAKIQNPEFPINVRLCKGIYIEPEKIAYKRKHEINRHFTEDLECMMQNNFYPAIATHDSVLIEKAFGLIQKYSLKQDQYEFQMLYGVTPALRKKVVSNGHKMRIYLPFGEKWFNYSTRRLKENPNMVGDIIKAFFVKK